MSEYQFNPNLLARYLQKPAVEFTRDDILRYIEEKEIKMINFRYVVEDGKLKTINFVVSGHDELVTLLTYGERVDGSRIFSFIPLENSDIFLIPKFRTAFLNPFSEIPAIDILCEFYDVDGKPLNNSPDYVLHKATRTFEEKLGMEMKVHGEIEFYILSHRNEMYPAASEYQGTGPYTRSESLRKEALQLVASCGGRVKMGHAEQGSFITEDYIYEQHEIKFYPAPPEEAADQIVIAKWILRMLGKRYGVNVTFIPKITFGQPGNGLHVNFLLEKEGKNCLFDDDQLNDITRKAIYGVLNIAGALCAFGNTIPISFLRLMPGQRVPLKICWGKGNRTALLRVPLGCRVREEDAESVKNYQTIEYRGSDGSANPYILFAALMVGIMNGMRNEVALERVPLLYVTENLFDEELDENKENYLENLPASCWDAAEKLEEQRFIFEEDDIFPPSLIDVTIQKLKSYEDQGLSEQHTLYGDDQKINELIKEYLGYM